MLSRSKSNTTIPLRRSDSSSSTSQWQRQSQRTSEPVEAENLRIHALIAAHRAMDRSNERPSSDLSRTDSNTSQRTVRRWRTDEFVHLSAATRLDRLRDLQEENSSSVATGLKPPLCQTKSNQYPYSIQSTQMSEFGNPGENYGAEPSSYRRLRKARSLLTPRRGVIGGSGSGSDIHTPFSQAPTLRRTTSSLTSAGTRFYLRLRRSLSFLRLPNDTVPLEYLKNHDGTSGEEAIKLARAQFLSQTNQQQTSESTLTTRDPIARRQQGAFRRSVRKSSQGDTETSSMNEIQISSPHQKPPGKHSFSSSIRNRIRQTFGRRSIHKGSIPPQHLNSSRAHYYDVTDSNVAENPLDDDQFDHTSRKSIYIPRGASKEFNEEDEKNLVDICSAGSRESLPSNIRSRVTSWTNSSVAGSVPLHGLSTEQNRLSVIREDATPYQSSSLAGRHVIGVPLPQMNSQLANIARPVNSQLDGQRLYSALMDRIRREDAEITRTQAALEETHEEEGHGTDAPKNVKPTIRAVTNDNSLPDWVCNLILDQPVEQENFSARRIPETASISTSYKTHNTKPLQHTIEQESQFFPFSSEANPQISSPLKKILEVRRSQERSSDDSTTTEANKTSLNRDHLAIKGSVGRSQRENSNDSIYSRTTDGGTNVNYISPLRSSEEFPPALGPIVPAIEDGSGVSYQQRASERSLSETYKSNIATDSQSSKNIRYLQNGAFKSRQRNSRAGGHFREHTQVFPDDEETVVSLNQEKMSNFARHSKTNTTDLTDVSVPSTQATGIEPDTETCDVLPSYSSVFEEIQQPSVPAARRRSSLSKSVGDLLKRASKITIKPNEKNNNENSKPDRQLRKSGSENMATVLSHKKSQAIEIRRPELLERSQNSAGSSSPIKFHERSDLQRTKSRNTEVLRNRSNEADLQPLPDHEATPKKKLRSSENRKTSLEESPSTVFSKTTFEGSSQTFRGGMSPNGQLFEATTEDLKDLGYPKKPKPDTVNVTAPIQVRRPKGYGGLGLSPIRTNTPNSEADRETAPANASTSSPNGSPTFSLWGTKRMVSNFLRSRGVGRNASTGHESQREGSPAFL